MVAGLAIAATATVDWAASQPNYPKVGGQELKLRWLTSPIPPPLGHFQVSLTSIPPQRRSQGFAKPKTSHSLQLCIDKLLVKSLANN